MHSGKSENKSQRPGRLAIFGCGYLGSVVLEEALRLGWEVTALTRNAEKAAWLRQRGAQQVIEANLASDDWHTQVPCNQDLAVNCVSAGGGGLEGYQRSYVEGNRSVLRWARGARMGTFVYTGSTGVYPQTAGETIDENASTAGCSAFGEALLEAEGIVLQGMREGSCFRRTFVLRLAGIYGPGRHYWLDRLVAGERCFPGEGRAWLNLIYRDDACRAIMAALQAPEHLAGGLYNVADGSPVERRELLEWLLRELQLPGEVAFDTGKARGHEGRGGRPGQAPNRRILAEKIRKELGWEPQFGDYRAGYGELLHQRQEGGSGCL